MKLVQLPTLINRTEKSKNLRYLITICCFIISVQTQAQRLKLDYEPHGQIIQFNFDGLTIYSDTTAVFSVIDNYNDPKHTEQTRALIINKLKESKKDTLKFSGHFIPFNDSVSNSNRKGWHIKHVVLSLADNEKLTVINQNGNQVYRIKKKKVKLNRDNSGMVKGSKISYINKDTGDELFSRFIQGVNSSPSW